MTEAEPSALAAENARLKAELSELEARYRLLSAATFEGITIHENGRHVAVNDAFAAMLGYPKEEIEGTTAWDLAAPESRPIIQERIRSGSDEPYEVVGIRRDGTRIDLEVRGKTLQEGDRRLRVTALRDISAKKRAERELQALYEQEQAAVRARDEFLSIAAHELRTPVTGLTASAQLIQRWQRRGQLDEARLQRILPTFVEECDRLSALVDDLLDVSRLRTGHLELRPSRIALASLVQSVVSRFQDLLNPRHSLTLEFDQVCWANVDPGRLEQVLANLLSNAIKYSPEGGPIHVALTATNGGARISVQDHGIGLPREEAERIFEPFGRASNATARQIPGMGLGLHIARGIVERHGGRIWAESAGEDQGLAVFVWFPCEAS